MNIILKLFLILLFIPQFSQLSFAALGGNESSIEADLSQIHGIRQIQNVAQYQIHQIQQDTGTLVKEYVLPQGLVFAISWQGPVLPNLEQILGLYFTDYQQTIQEKNTPRSPTTLRQDKVVIQSKGRMRAFQGIAYIPSLLPVGFSEKDIQ
jgi:hypothetical protein